MVTVPSPVPSPPQHDWVSRRADQGPKTIEQIHKEAKIEEQEEQRKVQQQLLNKDAAKRRPGRRLHGGLIACSRWSQDGRLFMRSF